MDPNKTFVSSVVVNIRSKRPARKLDRECVPSSILSNPGVAAVGLTSGETFKDSRPDNIRSREVNRGSLVKESETTTPLQRCETQSKKMHHAQDLKYVEQRNYSHVHDNRPQQQVLQTDSGCLTMQGSKACGVNDLIQYNSTLKPVHINENEIIACNAANEGLSELLGSVEPRTQASLQIVNPEESSRGSFRSASTSTVAKTNEESHCSSTMRKSLSSRRRENQSLQVHARRLPEACHSIGEVQLPANSVSLQRVTQEKFVLENHVASSSQFSSNTETSCSDCGFETDKDRLISSVSENVQSNSVCTTSRNIGIINNARAYSCKQNPARESSCSDVTEDRNTMGGRNLPTKESSHSLECIGIEKFVSENPATSSSQFSSKAGSFGAEIRKDYSQADEGVSCASFDLLSKATEVGKEMEAESFDRISGAEIPNITGNGAGGSSRVIGIFKGHVKQKSEVFESENYAHSTRLVSSFLGLSSDLSGKVRGFAAPLRRESCEGRHESQIVGEDAHLVDGHVRLKQNLFENLRFDALNEHGQTQSSQVVTRGGHRSRLGDDLNSFDSWKFGDVNENKIISTTTDHNVDDSVPRVLMSFKAMQNDTCSRNTRLYQEFRQVDDNAPVENRSVKEHAERFLHEDFYHKAEFKSSQNVTDEEKVAASGLFASLKREFESKPLHFIGIEDRPEKHPSQLVDDDYFRNVAVGAGIDDCILSEPHSSRKIDYHESHLGALTHVQEKKRQYYDNCDSSVGCSSRKLIEASEILNAQDLLGIVKQTAAAYLAIEQSSQLDAKTSCGRGYRSDVYVKPLRSKFETQTLSDLGKSEDLHPSQCTEIPEVMSEETQKSHLTEFTELPGLHASQLIDPAEYAAIKSAFRTKRRTFAAKFPTKTKSIDSQPNPIEKQVGPAKAAFESCSSINAPTLHPSQIVGRDIHVISSNEVQHSHSRVEVPKLHESQKVNYGIAGASASIHEQRTLADHFLPSCDFSLPNSRKIAPPQAIFKSSKSVEDDNRDLELLLNYTPAILQDLPSMSTIMAKEVTDKLVKSDCSKTEYFPNSKEKSIRSHVLVSEKTSSTSPCLFSKSENSESSRDLCPTTNGNQSKNSSDWKLDKFENTSEKEQANLVPAFPPPLSPPSVDGGIPDLAASLDDQDFSQSPFPPPPPPQFVSENLMFDEREESDCTYFVESGNSDLDIGPTLLCPLKCDSVVSALEEELPRHVRHEDALKEERFTRRALRQLTSSSESFGAALPVRDEVKLFSRATVDSLPESDDRWDSM